MYAQNKFHKRDERTNAMRRIKMINRKDMRVYKRMIGME